MLIIWRPAAPWETMLGVGSSKPRANCQVEAWDKIEMMQDFVEFESFRAAQFSRATVRPQTAADKDTAEEKYNRSKGGLSLLHVAQNHLERQDSAR